MNGNFYSNEQLANMRHADRIAEAEAYRNARLVEQSTMREQPARNAVFRPFGWIRRLVLRIGGAAA